MESLASTELLSPGLQLVGIGLAFSGIHLSGVFVFNSQEVRRPDAQVLAAVRTIGGQVGQFLQREHKVAA